MSRVGQNFGLANPVDIHSARFAEGHGERIYL
jgi:hypothetical protein